MATNTTLKAVIASYIASLVQTITNKSIDLANNTLTGTVAQFNTALSDDDFVTLTGTETLTNKTLTAPALGTPASGTLTNCTLPVSGITASTSTAIGVGSIELGHASDTTLARSSAGVVSIEGSGVLTQSLVQVSTTSTLASAGAREYFYLLNSGAVPTIPTAVGNTSIYNIRNSTGSPINLAATSSQTFDGSAGPLAIAAGAHYRLKSDSSNWFTF